MVNLCPTKHKCRSILGYIFSDRTTFGRLFDLITENQKAEKYGQKLGVQKIIRPLKVQKYNWNVDGPSRPKWTVPFLAYFRLYYRNFLWSFIFGLLLYNSYGHGTEDLNLKGRIVKNKCRIFIKTQKAKFYFGLSKIEIKSISENQN